MNRRQAVCLTPGLLFMATVCTAAQSDQASIGFGPADLARYVDAFVSGTPIHLVGRKFQVIREIRIDIEHQQSGLLVSNVSFDIDPNYEGYGDSKHGAMHAAAIRSGKAFGLQFILRNDKGDVDYGSAGIDGIADVNRFGFDEGWRYRLPGRKAFIPYKVALPPVTDLKANPDSLRLWMYITVPGESTGSGSGPSMFNNLVRI